MAQTKSPASAVPDLVDAGGRSRPPVPLRSSEQDHGRQCADRAGLRGRRADKAPYAGWMPSAPDPISEAKMALTHSMIPGTER